MPWDYFQRPYFVSNIRETYTQSNLKTINLRLRKSQIKTDFWNSSSSFFIRKPNFNDTHTPEGNLKPKLVKTFNLGNL